MVILTLAFLGLAFGSFINALVWRLHKQGTGHRIRGVEKAKKKLSTLTPNSYPIIRGRSMCVHCHHELAWYDLIPVLSWILLSGKCRYCQKFISWQYPMVELATAGLFVLSYLAWPRELMSGFEWAYFALWLAALVLMIALTVYDLRWLQLPDKLVWPFVLTGVTSVAILGTQDDAYVLSHLFGVAAAWSFFALLYYGSRGKWLGGGDVKFSLGLGAWLGAGSTLVAVLAAFYSASIVIIPLLLLKIVKRKQPIPFGPFLILGTIIAMLWGQELTDWYKDTFLPPGL